MQTLFAPRSTAKWHNMRRSCHMAGDGPHCHALSVPRTIVVHVALSLVVFVLF